MSILARRLLRSGKWLANTGLNPARWSEGLGHKLGFRMREKVAPRMTSPAVAAVPAKNQVGLPERPSGSLNNAGQPIMLPATQDYSPAVAGIEGKAAQYADVPYLSRPLTDAGMAMQGIGYAGLAGGIGTLGYNMMKGDGTEPATDANGVKNPKFNEEMAKFRSKFQAEKLGGDKMFSAPKYRALRDQNPWIRTAIEQIGKEKYVALKQQLADGTLEGGAAKMHSILTDAIAELGDEETLKQAGSQPYVLPGLVSSGKSKRVIVIAPMKGKKGNETTMQALKYALSEEQGQGEQQ